MSTRITQRSSSDRVMAINTQCFKAPASIKGKTGETLKEANRTDGLEITAKALDCFRGGEGLDFHMAVGAPMTYDADPGDTKEANHG